MYTVHNKVLSAFAKTNKILLGHSKKNVNEAFEMWKYELRHNDITCDVINALDGIPQGTHYHPEFDALKHVWYVCRAVLKMHRQELLESAFLHDYGKGSKTIIGENRIYHFGHPVASVKYIDSIKNYLVDYELARRIADEHMKYDVDNKKLRDDKDLRDFVNADKEVSKKLYLGEATATDLIANQMKEDKVHLVQRTSKKKLYVMVGIPGSGKSRYLKNMDKRLIVSPDAIRRELFGDVNTHRTNEIPAQEVWNVTAVRLRVALELFGEAYLDATNVHKFSRVEFMASFNDCRKTAIVFEVDPEVAKERIDTDIKNGVNRSNVPHKAVDKMFKNFGRSKKSLANEFNEVIYF